jgi:hypothetical protein
MHPSHQLHLEPVHTIQLSTGLAHMVGHIIKDATDRRTPRGLTREQTEILEQLTAVLLAMEEEE